MEKYNISVFDRFEAEYKLELIKLREYIASIICNSTGSKLYIDLENYYQELTDKRLLARLIIKLKYELKQLGWKILEYQSTKIKQVRKRLFRKPIVIRETYPYMMIIKMV